VKKDAKDQLVVEPATDQKAVESLPSPMATSPFHAVYSGCASAKGCFGTEADCVSKGNCEVTFFSSGTG
jgi:hypothetical protein